MIVSSEQTIAQSDLLGLIPENKRLSSRLHDVSLKICIIYNRNASRAVSSIYVQH